MKKVTANKVLQMICTTIIVVSAVGLMSADDHFAFVLPLFVGIGGIHYLWGTQS
jgi:hypothetical protein